MPIGEEMQSLTQDIISSYEARLAGIASLHEGVTAQRQAARAHLDELVGAHKAMGRQLRADLAKIRVDLNKAESQRCSEVHAWIKAVASDHKAMGRQLRTDLAKIPVDLNKAESQRCSEVHAWIKAVASDHKAMGRQLRADLAKIPVDLNKAESQRCSEVYAWIKAVASDHSEAREAWRKMTATIQSKRGGVAIAVKLPIEEIPEKTQETAALREQVFKYLANRPDGTRLVDLAKEFGIARIQIAKTVKNLMDENKVEKRDLLYFAI